MDWQFVPHIWYRWGEIKNRWHWCPSWTNPYLITEENWGTHDDDDDGQLDANAKPIVWVYIASEMMLCNANRYFLMRTHHERFMQLNLFHICGTMTESVATHSSRLQLSIICMAQLQLLCSATLVHDAPARSCNNQDGSDYLLQLLHRMPPKGNVRPWHRAEVRNCAQTDISFV